MALTLFGLIPCTVGRLEEALGVVGVLGTVEEAGVWGVPVAVADFS